MDFPHYFSVLRRQKWLVLIGLIVALVAAVGSSYRYSDGKLVERNTGTYMATTRLIVGSPNRPLVATNLPDNPANQTQGYTPQDLAEIYPYLVVSDQLLQQIETAYGRPLRGPESIDASRPLGQPQNRIRDGVIAPNQSVIPIVEITGTAASPDAAQKLTQVAADTFVKYIVDQQTAAKVPTAEQVTISQTQAPGPGARVDSGPLGTAALVFVAVFAFFLLLAFISDGMRQRRRKASAASTEPSVAGISGARSRQLGVDEPFYSPWPEGDTGEPAQEQQPVVRRA